MMLHRALIGAAAASLTLGITVRAQAPTASPTTPRSATTRQTTTRPPAVSPQVAAQQREVFLKACARCHPPEFVTQTRRTKDQWEESINQMVTARGAVLTPEEYTTVLAYLAREWGPVQAQAGGNRRAGTPTATIAVTPGGTRAPAAGTQRAGTSPATGTSPTAAPAAGAPVATTAAATPPARPRGGAGPDDKHIVDAAAATRGRKTYASACIQCHGTQARGGQGGSNILRSSTLLHDRYGNLLGPFLRKDHPVQSGPPASSYTDTQIVDLSHFLRERFNDTLRGSPIFIVQNVLTGDRRSGEAYFNGDGGCRECHSPTGDLKGIGARLDPPALQQRFLFPRPPTRGPRAPAPAGGAAGVAVAKPTTVTVTTASGETVTGVLVSLDDFTVALRDPNGGYRSFKRAADLTVVKNDPYAAHVALLDKYTDKNMHDIVAYLESLK
jgi:cytochrome c oxidase cbb3-type subunit III